MIRRITNIIDNVQYINQVLNDKRNKNMEGDKKCQLVQ